MRRGVCIPLLLKQSDSQQPLLQCLRCNAVMIVAKADTDAMTNDIIVKSIILLYIIFDNKIINYS